MRMSEAEFAELEKRMAKKGLNVFGLSKEEFDQAVAQSVTTVTPAAHPPRKSTDEEKLNKTERAYLAHLRMLGYNPGIQNVTVKLAFDTRFTPDFSYYDANDNFILVDTKGGFVREDSWIKIKAAARLFPRWIWQVVSKTKCGWDIKEVKP